MERGPMTTDTTEQGLHQTHSFLFSKQLDKHVGKTNDLRTVDGSIAKEQRKWIHFDYAN